MDQGERRQSALCAIIGFIPAGASDFQSVLLATQDESGLRFLGQVGTGFKDKLRAKLNGMLRERVQSTPVILSMSKARGGIWVTPEIFCRIGYAE